MSGDPGRVIGRIVHPLDFPEPCSCTDPKGHRAECPSNPGDDYVKFARVGRRHDTEEGEAVSDETRVGRERYPKPPLGVVPVLPPTHYCEDHEGSRFGGPPCPNCVLIPTAPPAPTEAGDK